MKITHYIAIFFSCLIGLPLTAQETQRSELMQVSGVCLTGDSLTRLPFAEVMIKNTYRGTVSDYYGIFSLVAKKGDTLVFNSLGYHEATYILPDTLTKDRYTLIQIMQMDTVELDGVNVYPWPSKEQFKQAFLNLNATDDQYELARKNLAQKDMQAIAAAMSPDGAASYSYAMQTYQAQLYYAGQVPSVSLLNPVAWSQFLKAWRRGDFKQ